MVREYLTSLLKLSCIIVLIYGGQGKLSALGAKIITRDSDSTKFTLGAMQVELPVGALAQRLTIGVEEDVAPLINDLSVIHGLYVISSTEPIALKQAATISFVLDRNTIASYLKDHPVE